MYRILLVTLLLLVTVTLMFRAAQTSGQAQQRTFEVQRHGTCADLPIFGVGTHRGRNPDHINIKLLTESEAGIARLDIPWIDLERNSQYNFSPFDNLIGQLRARGKSIVLVLAYGHPDHSDGRAENGFPFPPRTADQRHAFAKYAQAVAQKYHGSDIAYEIWNEPNLALFWPPSPNPELYGALLGEAAQAIRDIQPAATIISGGLANEHNPASFLQAVALSGNLTRVDGLTFHPYRQNGPEHGLSDIAKFESAAGSDHRSLWITEWGYSDAWSAKIAPEAPRQRSAVMVARLMLTAAMANAKALLVYDLIDDGRNPLEQEAGFGLYDYDFKPKPAAGAFRSLAGLMSNCSTYAFTSDPAQSTIAAKFSSTTKTTSVIWTYATGASSVICYDHLGGARPTNLQDLYGNALPLDSCGPASGIKLRISESSGPLLLSADPVLAK